MPSTTGIELGPDSCVLVRARTGHRTCEVSALHVFAFGEWPADGAARVELLRETRRTGRFPRRARLTLWDSSPAPVVSDAAVAGALRLLRQAGFRVQAVLDPPQALAALAALRPRYASAGVAWLSVNTHGAAIAILRGSDVLFSRIVLWSASHPSDGIRNQLLHRYSLVAHIAPELLRGIAAVRQMHQLAVETVVTCGNLPDLRSLTMPLIEELDMEVETLDSAEGLRATTPAVSDAVVEFAPVLRLACGAAMTRAAAPRASRRHLAAAVLVAAVGVLGVVAFSQRSVVRPVPVEGNREPRLEAAARRIVAPAPSVPFGGTEKVPDTGAPPPAPPEVLKVPSPAERPAGAASSAAPPRQRPAAAALDAPLPRVTSILVGERRRFAILDGRIVAAGDTVGPRVVLRIEDDAVILKEPSGLEVRVALKPAPSDEVKFTPSVEQGRLAAGSPGSRSS